MHTLGLNLEGNEMKNHEIDNVSNSIKLRENRFQYNP